MDTVALSMLYEFESQKKAMREDLGVINLECDLEVKWVSNPVQSLNRDPNGLFAELKQILETEDDEDIDDLAAALRYEMELQISIYGDQISNLEAGHYRPVPHPTKIPVKTIAMHQLRSY